MTKNEKNINKQFIKDMEVANTHNAKIVSGSITEGNTSQRYQFSSFMLIIT